MTSESFDAGHHGMPWCPASLRAALSTGLLALCWAVASMAQGATPPGVTLPGSREFSLASAETGGDYLIQVSLPDAPPPAGGYPVLYLLDGNARLPLVQAARDTLTRRGPNGDGSPWLIVAIGYPDTRRFDLERRALDYTPAVAGRDEADDRHGGADAFLDFIESRLKPEIASRFPVDTAREALFGHSYGGLLTVHALMTRPTRFARYIAISPSLWWYGEAPLAHLAALGALEREDGEAPRVMLGVGGDEQTPGEGDLGTPRAERLRERAMIDNARRFADWLAVHRPGWRVGFSVFPGEDHGSVMWPATRAALAFLHSP
ncbi:alpha/beta hydrolase [Halomonas sp. B23F22_10]|uniref:alpha/beta hydrolase n=1 Tax=Halomonas sp. B23F22_10 TaxID=3459515 RepID=UPI00373EDCF2